MKKNFILILLIILLIPFACRYKEGPAISLRSVKSRLIGNWNVTEFTSDGIDSLKYYNDSCGCLMHIPDLSDELDINVFGYNKEFGGSFSFTKNKKIMHVYFKQHASWYKNIGPIGINSDWKILRLTKEEFKISTNVNNRNYLISFKKE